ncbi:MAG: hypothetical protein IPG74_11660 [Flavobacteriales bacterium]|nr:hypothetical protein [Flavobacteriales bacterium]MBK7554788.1 hypothetical protein [Flavobacteriales bacterium]MBK9196210.1 hypothetical protein [Flavobacteriales bacterium]MBP6574835.1 hypothetical protein [Flavobacteriales bacterium]
MSRSAALPILLFSAAVALATWFALYLSERPFGWPYVVMLGYFAVISLLLHAWQEKSAGEVKVFMRRFMTGLVVKLMLSVVVLVVLLVTAPDGYRKPMSIAFVLLYLAFLGFSTGRLVMLIRKGDTAAP